MINDTQLNQGFSAIFAHTIQYTIYNNQEL